MDRGGIEQRTLSLVIKTPSQAHGDQTVDGVDPGWTVGDLKAHLSSVYPDRPVSCVCVCVGGGGRLWPFLRPPWISFYFVFVCRCV